MNSKWPPCDYRGAAVGGGRRRCDCPSLRAPHGVTADHCRRCPFRATGIDKPVARHRGGNLSTEGIWPCRHLGAATGDQVECESCAGRVRLKVFECGIHGSCTTDRSVPRHACCRGCPDRSARTEPRRDVVVDLPGHFNAGLALWEGELLLASRRDERIWMSTLGADLQPTDTWPIDVELPRVSCVEDPRLWEHGGQLHLSYTALEDLHPRGQRAHVGVTALRDPRTVARSWIPEFRARNIHEKNWAFFSFLGDLYAVYAVHPHRILRFDGDVAIELPVETAPLPWAHVHLRGGAPPLRVGDEYWHVAHTVRAIDRRHEYSAVLYTFEAAWPFAPKRALPGHLHLASWHSVGGYSKNVVFPCGTTVLGAELLMSYGLHDRETRVAAWKIADLDAALRPVTPTPARIGGDG